MGNDVEGVVERDERQEVEARYVLDGVFIADFFGERGVAENLGSDSLDFGNQFGV